MSYYGRNYWGCPWGGSIIYTNRWDRSAGFMRDTIYPLAFQVDLPEHYRKVPGKRFELTEDMHGEIVQDENISGYAIVQKLYKMDTKEEREEYQRICDKRRFWTDNEAIITFATQSEAAYFNLKWC